MNPGGGAPYRKGAAYENACMDVLQLAGWVCVRSAGSHTPMDIMAAKRGARRNGHTLPDYPDLLLVQCKLGGRLRPAEKAELLEAADRACATAILATRNGWYRLHPDGKEPWDLGPNDSHVT